MSESNNTPEKKKPKKNLSNSYSLREDFKYGHQNPYHDKLDEFNEFVLRDLDCEKYKANWNKQVFQNEFPIDVEIGTGFGNFMLDVCTKMPERNFVGLDHRFKRSYQVAQKLSLLPHRNFRYLRARGERIHFMFAAEEVDKIFFFFPDPWPKLRHHKKRLFQKPFLDACHHVLKKGGELLVKTDHDGYFEWMLEEMKSETRFETLLQSHDVRTEFPEHFLCQFSTNFEKIFLAQKIQIKAIVLKKL